MTGSKSIAVLTEDHATLALLFARHQEALVAHSWARAARLLDHYRKRLEYRILLEEQYLLPYGTEKNMPPEWQSYIAEHRRLEELLNSTCARLATARRRGVTASALIALLDDEKTLKHALEQHLQREEEQFSPASQDALPEEVSSELMLALRHTEIGLAQRH
ncbi:MAG TPA: hemerythrin domain-containing protein [Gammaproteobacteria bacterium]|nr:hemerythrin domain-containing protein [Gammaproteobacteria bacterium]